MEEEKKIISDKLLCIFYSEFDIEKGAEIKYEKPKK
jgi:hypothetical protein